MTLPDSNTWLIFLGSTIGWVVAWFHGQRSGIRKAVLMEWQHRAMWQEFAGKRKLPINGGK
jgi:hypothetical protein